MAFDAGNIFQTYMQGANFVAGSLERAEKQRRQQEEDELQSVAGKGLEIFAPKYDKDGKLLPRTSGDIFNDPATLELANHPYMKSARMQGITDPKVKDVRYVGGSPLEDGKHVVPIVEQLDEDGNVISRGPLTEGRSRDGSAAVTPITVDAMFNHLAGEVYRRNPTLGKELVNRAHIQALGGLQTQYRNAQTDNEREQLVQIWSSYGGSPEDLMKNSGAPIVKPDLKTGLDVVQNPGGGYRYQKNPQTAELRGEVVAQERADHLKTLKDTQEQNFQVEGEQRGTRQEWRSDQYAKDAEDKMAMDELLAERRRALAAGDADAVAAANEKISQRYEQSRTNRDVRHASALADAGAQSDYRNAPTTRETHRITNPGQIPAEQEAANIIEARQIIKDVPGLLNGGPDASYKRVADLAPFLPKDERGGLRARLLAEGPRAAPALRALAEVDGGLRAEGGEVPKPGEFNETGVKDWTSDLPDEQKNQIRLRGRQLYEDASKVFPTAKGSQEETDLNMAVGEALRENLPNHVLPLVNWTQLQKNPDYAPGITSSREFIENIHTPIVELSKQRGLSLNPSALSGVERMAVGLRARGIPYSDAVVSSVDLEKDSARVDKIARLLPTGVTPAEREKVFLDILASDLKKTRFVGLKVNPNGPKPSTVGRGGLWR